MSRHLDWQPVHNSDDIMRKIKYWIAENMNRLLVILLYYRNLIYVRFRENNLPTKLDDRPKTSWLELKYKKKIRGSQKFSY